MDSSSSVSESICNEGIDFRGSGLCLKARKPYTITKQREKWTQEEHEKFMESLKLYGRAWRRIEERIGTKSAVQIRSHAQKFFSKLEKEPSSGGNSSNEGEEFDIPPPRPKRKPTHPYPRKAPPPAAPAHTPKRSNANSATTKGSFKLESELSISAMASTAHHHTKIRGGAVESPGRAFIKLFGQTMHVDVPSVTGKGVSQSIITSKETESSEAIVSVASTKPASKVEIEFRKLSSRAKAKLADTPSASAESNQSTVESSISLISPSWIISNEKEKASPQPETSFQSHFRNSAAVMQNAVLPQHYAAPRVGADADAANPDTAEEHLHRLAAPLQLWQQNIPHHTPAAASASHAYWPLIMQQPTPANPPPHLSAINSSDSTTTPAAAADQNHGASVATATAAAASAWWAIQAAANSNTITLPPSLQQPYPHTASSAPNYNFHPNFAAPQLENEINHKKRKRLVNLDLNIPSTPNCQYREAASSEHQLSALQMHPISYQYSKPSTLTHCSILTAAATVAETAAYESYAIQNTTCNTASAAHSSGKTHAAAIQKLSAAASDSCLTGLQFYEQTSFPHKIGRNLTNQHASKAKEYANISQLSGDGSAPSSDSSVASTGKF